MKIARLKIYSSNFPFPPLPQTMESISKKLGFLLEGKPYEEMFEFCDFSLNEQNEATTAKGIQASVQGEAKNAKGGYLAKGCMFGHLALVGIWEMLW